MNNKILSIKRTSAIFLATVLVLGTITLLSTPSFMKDVQAQQDYRTNSYDSEYGMDNDYKDRYGKDIYESQYSSYGKDNYKSKDSNKIVKKINCNNINVNINGLELTTLPPSLGGLLSDGERDEGQYGSYGGVGGQSGYDKNNNSFKFVCINNNNNTVIGGGEEPPIPLTCEECFTENLTVEQLTNLTDLLANSEVLNLEGLCEALSNATLPNQEKITGLSFLFLVAGITDEDTVIRILECLEELGLITVPSDFEFPPEE